MIALFDALVIGFLVLIVVLMFLSHRASKRAAELTTASGYYAGLYDASVACGGERPSNRDREWDDEDWYLKHCAGVADKIVEEGDLPDR